MSQPLTAPHKNEGLAAYILFHLRGSGPVNFNSMVNWIHTHYHESTPPWAIAQALNELIKSGDAYLCDTGDAFEFRRK